MKNGGPTWPSCFGMLWLPFILIFAVFFAYHFWLKHFETTPSQQLPSFDHFNKNIFDHLGSIWNYPRFHHVSPWGQVLESVRRGEAEEAEEEEAFEPKIHEGRHQQMNMNGINLSRLRIQYKLKEICKRCTIDYNQKCLYTSCICKGCT